MVGERKKKEKGSLERKEDVERERECVCLREGERWMCYGEGCLVSFS